MTDFDYGTIPVGYYDVVFRRKRGIQSRWHHDKFDHFRSRIRPGERHIDIGCGPGTFIATLGGDIESIGVDIAREQIEYARKNNGRPGARFECISQERLPYDDDSFDVVTSIELLEHLSIPHCKTLIAEMHRVIRPGGRLLLSTPNYHSLWPVVEMLVNRMGPVSYEDQHITHFSAKSLRATLACMPWRDMKVGAYQFLAPFTAFLGWSVASAFRRLEPEFLTARAGMLLFAEATK